MRKFTKLLALTGLMATSFSASAAVGATYTGTTEAGTVNGSETVVSIDYSITYNENKTLTVNWVFTGAPDSAVINEPRQINIADDWYSDTNGGSGLNLTYTTTKEFNDGETIAIFFYYPNFKPELNSNRADISYTIGSATGETPVDPDPVKENPTVSFPEEGKFSLSAEGDVVLTGSINVTNPDNVMISSIRLAAATGSDRAVEGEDYGIWTVNGDYIFGETTLTNVVAGNNTFTITIPKNKIKQDVNTDFWPKYFIAFDGGTADGGVGPWNVNPSALGSDPKPVDPVNIDIAASIAAGEFVCTGPASGQIPFEFTVIENANLDHVTGFRIWADSEGNITKGQTEINKDLRKGTLTVSALNEYAQTNLWLKVQAIMEEGYSTNTVETVVGAVSTAPLDPSVIGEAVNSVEGTINATVRNENNEIIWSCPIEGYEGSFNGISGDYIQSATNPYWSNSFNYTVSNDAAGHIMFDIEFTDDLMTGFVCEVYINRIRYNATINGKTAHVNTGEYTYMDGKVVSYLFYFAYPDGNAQTKVFTYEIKNCDKKEQSFTIESILTNILGDDATLTRGTVNHYSTTEAADGIENIDWTHTACPVDGHGEYWNPNFDFVIANPKTEANEPTPIYVSLRYENGTMIPSNFDPQFFVYPVDADGELIPEGDGYLRYGPYHVTPVPSVVNLYTGFTAELSTSNSKAAKAAGSEPVDGKFYNGDYMIEFYKAYVPVRATTTWGAYSNTKPMSFTVDNGQTTGIDEVIGDVNVDGPVEFYNLQGVRVENPSNGLYIRRQGNKVEKIIIR